MAKILHLETSTKACSVALSVNGNLVALKEDVTEDFSHSENLTLFIQDVLDQSCLELKDLDAVSVVSGPGSYTGLRIGVSTAKGLCYALSIPLISVDSLVSMVSTIKEKYPNKNLLSLIDARRMEVFSAIYSPDLTIVKPISADIIEADTYTEFEPLVYFGDGAAKLQEIWASRSNMEFIQNVNASAIGQMDIAYEKFKNGDFEDVAYFEPFYLKDFMSTKKK